MAAIAAHETPSEDKDDARFCRRRRKRRRFVHVQAQRVAALNGIDKRFFADFAHHCHATANDYQQDKIEFPVHRFLAINF